MHTASATAEKQKWQILNLVPNRAENLSNVLMLHTIGKLLKSGTTFAKEKKEKNEVERTNRRFKTSKVGLNN